MTCVPDHGQLSDEPANRDQERGNKKSSLDSLRGEGDISRLLEGDSVLSTLTSQPVSKVKGETWVQAAAVRGFAISGVGVDRGESNARPDFSLSMQGLHGGENDQHGHGQYGQCTQCANCDFFNSF